MSAKFQSPEELLRQQFSQLKTQMDNQEFDQALHICEKILLNHPDDTDAQKSKTACLLRLSKFEAALELLEKGEPSFELAYCYYKLHRLELALATATNAEAQNGPSTPLRLLHAQILYRLERHAESVEAYEQIKAGLDRPDPELEVNLSAARALLARERAERGLPTNADQWKESRGKDATWEVTYNSAFGSIVCGDYSHALKLLEVAEAECRKDFEDASEEELLDDLSPILVQRGYIFQCMGKEKEALETYNQFIQHRPSDISSTAIAQNNIVVLRGDRDLFDSIKKVRAAASTALDSKLVRYQKRAIAFNHALLLLLMHKYNQCRDLLKVLSEKFPDSDIPTLIEASLLTQEKRFDDCESFLRKKEQDSIRAKLALAQVQIFSNRMKAAALTLQSIEKYRHLPGIVATVVSLFLSEDNIGDAESVLNTAVEYWSESYENETDRTASEANLLLILRKLASFYAALSKPREAAAAYERMVGITRSDQTVFANFVLNLSLSGNMDKAEQYVEYLATNLDSESIDIEELEAAALAGSRSRQTLVPKTDQAQGEAVIDATEIVKKKKRKRKPRLPKNLDPNTPIDPERWLPVQERSYYKRRHGKSRFLGKGSQGMVPDKGKGPTQQDKPQPQPQQHRSSRKQQKKKGKGKKKR